MPYGARSGLSDGYVVDAERQYPREQQRESEGFAKHNLMEVESCGQGIERDSLDLGSCVCDCL